MKTFVTCALLLLTTAPALAQIQGGPNIAPNGTRFTYSPRFNYLGPPVAFVPYPPPVQNQTMPIVPVPRAPLPPPPLPAPPPMTYEPPPCVITFDPWVPLLNVRASPNGWIVGQLSNGTPVIPTGEVAGNWMVIAAPVPGWVFRPYVACLPPPPIDAYAYQPPDTGPVGSPPVRQFRPPAADARPLPPISPVPRPPSQRQRPSVPCPDGCPREPDDT